MRKSWRISTTRATMLSRSIRTISVWLTGWQWCMTSHTRIVQRFPPFVFASLRVRPLRLRYPATVAMRVLAAIDATAGMYTKSGCGLCCHYSCAGLHSAYWAIFIRRQTGRRAFFERSPPSRRWHAIRWKRTFTGCRSCTTICDGACSVHACGANCRAIPQLKC